MSITGAIFDMDGTLFDSMFIWDTIGAEYLRSIGYEPKDTINETFKTMSLYQAACHYRDEYGVTMSTNEIIDDVNKMIARYYQDVVQLKNGVQEFLNKLSENGVKMCIATAADQYLVEAALKRTNIKKYFTDILTCESVGHGKDEPIIYRDALRHLQTEKEKTLIFEDALYAIKTAQYDYFTTVGIYDSYEKNQEEVKKISDYYMFDFSDFNSFWKFASRI